MNLLKIPSLILTFFTLLDLLLSATILLGQSSTQAEITLCFRDSQTGYAVQPQSVLIYDEMARETVDVTESSLKSDGAMKISLSQAEYQLSVRAQNYDPLSTRFQADSSGNLPMKIFLDPIQPHPKLEFNYIRSLHKNDATLVTGFVVDEETGQPISDVQITSSQNGDKISTDEQGYFLIYLPASSVSGTVKFKKFGYVTQKRINIKVWPNGDWQYRIQLKQGAGEVVINDGKMFGRENQLPKSLEDAEECEDCGSTQNEEDQKPITLFSSTDPVLLRNTIRVGRNCTGTSCTRVEVYTLQTYAKFVLPHEWFSCWGSLNNGMNSLQAGAVAIRTFGSWFVYHPLASNYDICDNIYCQFFGSSQTSNGNVAVDATERFVLVNASNEIVRSEYAAENNNAGCGDGYSGTGITYPCIFDPVCAGQFNRGHGRGLCQWGSVRWATATVVDTADPCVLGNVHSYGSKTWQEILTHYYPDYQLVEGTSAAITDVHAIPNQVSPDEAFIIEYTIEAAPAVSLMLGASVRPAAANYWIDDPANDRKVSVNSGVSNVARQFHLPDTASPGDYDILAALWYDLDNNNQINSGDFRLDRQLFSEAFTVAPSLVERLNNHIPADYRLSQNYPNPFNPRTTIEFAIPHTAQVRLKIFNSLGEEAATLVDDLLSPGNYKAGWDAGDFASGIYFYRLSVTELTGQESRFINTKKLILSK